VTVCKYTKENMEFKKREHSLTWRLSFKSNWEREICTEIYTREVRRGIMWWGDKTLKALGGKMYRVFTQHV
jgi:hypothetical protein